MKSSIRLLRLLTISTASAALLGACATADRPTLVKTPTSIRPKPDNLTPLVEAGNKLPRFAGVKLSGLGRIEVGVFTKVGRSAVAHAPKRAALAVEIVSSRKSRIEDFISTLGQ